MKVTLKRIQGPWADGWVLDKHMQKSTYLGDDAYGHPQFDNQRTEVGEATYQLKYQHDWDQAARLAKALADNIYPMFSNVGFIVPMPASTPRIRQPVAEVAAALGSLVGRPVFMDLLRQSRSGISLKNLQTKEDKIAAIKDRFSINDEIADDGQWNVLVIDDLFHTGASMETACKALQTYPKVRKIFVAALTWRPA